MDLSGIAVLLGAVATTVGATVAGVSKAWRSSVQRAVLEQQAKDTVEAKNKELAARDEIIHDLKDENEKLWKLLDGVTA